MSENSSKNGQQLGGDPSDEQSAVIGEDEPRMAHTLHQPMQQAARDAQAVFLLPGFASDVQLTAAVLSNLNSAAAEHYNRSLGLNVSFDAKQQVQENVRGQRMEVEEELQGQQPTQVKVTKHAQGVKEQGTIDTVKDGQEVEKSMARPIGKSESKEIKRENLKRRVRELEECLKRAKHELQCLDADDTSSSPPKADQTEDTSPPILSPQTQHEDTGPSCSN